MKNCRLICTVQLSHGTKIVIWDSNKLWTVKSKCVKVKFLLIFVNVLQSYSLLQLCVATFDYSLASRYEAVTWINVFNIMSWRQHVGNQLLKRRTAALIAADIFIDNICFVFLREVFSFVFLFKLNLAIQFGLQTCSAVFRSSSTWSFFKCCNIISYLVQAEWSGFLNLHTDLLLYSILTESVLETVYAHFPLDLLHLQ